MSGLARIGPLESRAHPGTNHCDLGHSPPEQGREGLPGPTARSEKGGRNDPWKERQVLVLKRVLGWPGAQESEG